MRIFISGGCRNGKSTYAQILAKHQQTEGSPLFYVATMNAADTEDEERIRKHRQNREGLGFTTIEKHRRIEDIVKNCSPHDLQGSFLLDSITALLANEMFIPGGEVNHNAHEQIASGILMVLENISRIVIVSDYIYSDAMLYDTLTEHYRKSLAALDRLTAMHCDIVLEVAYTNIIVHKGMKLYKEFFNEFSCKKH